MPGDSRSPGRDPTDIPSVPRTSARLRVGLIAPPWVPVPPPVYGGTELVVDLLARGLVRDGHEVVLFTTGDSTCPVPRRWTYATALGTAGAPVGERRHVEQAYQAMAADGVDVIHDHTLTGPLLGDVHPPGIPVLTTAHGRMDPRSRDIYLVASDGGVGVVAISDAQRRSAPEVPFVAVIPHGIDVSSFPLGRGDGGYVAFLGRMSPDKGVDIAIRVARSSGRRLVIAAKIWEADEKRYFAEVVEPMLGDGVDYIGQVDTAQKRDLLAGAEALLNPIHWPEPFGLVMVESMACGTPVLAFPYGAAPEIVAPGRTGFLCTGEEDMVDRLAEVGGLDRRACRAHVAAHFSAERMVDDHVALYRRVLGDPPALDVAGDQRQPVPQ